MENYGTILAYEHKYKILNRILAIQIQQYFKRKIKYESWTVRLFPWNKYGLILGDVLMQFVTWTDGNIKITWSPQ